MRSSLAILTALATACSISEVSADWPLVQPTAPYVMGYAPTGAVAPILGTVPMSVSQPVVLTPANAAPISNGVYQSQRPVYVDNPSVYTGMPTGNVQASYYGAAPVTSYAPATTPSPYRDIAPLTFYRPQVDSTPGGPVIITTPSGAPTTALPPTQVTPLFPPAPPPKRKCFLSRLFGTDYTTSYYRAPITYYRPAISLDPMTAFQPPPSYGPAPAACPSPTYSQPLPSQYGIGQVGAMGPAGQGAASIPSTLPPTSYGPNDAYGNSGGFSNGGYNGGGYGPNGYNIAPLQGAPPAPSATGDLAPMDRPELNRSALPPSTVNGNGSMNTNGSTNSNTGTSESEPSTEPAPSNYWKLQNAEDSTAMVRPRSSYSMAGDPQSFRGGVDPIAAPDNYQSPFRNRAAPVAAPPDMSSPQSFQAPPLPRHSPTDPAELTAVSARQPMVNQAPAPQPPAARPMKRDSTWYPVGR
jgi:hypothetical protein